MNIIRNEPIAHLKHQSKQLIHSMLSPLCGLNQEIGFVSRTRSDVKLMVGSAALTGVHVLFQHPNPGRGAYHIGGTGIFPNEAMIRILAESVERYAQLVSNFTFLPWLRYSNYQDIKTNLRQDEEVLSQQYFSLYTNSQLSRSRFPFQSYLPEHRLSWLKMSSCFESSAMWVPAQFVLVGYDIKRKEGEPWITSAVTTGTATHVTYPLACKAALLELIQLDTVIGHWYSDWHAYRIELDHRVAFLSALMKRYAPANRHQYHFYYIPNPDLSAFTVACLYLQETALPKIVIGLGADTSLENAMYKAFLEAVASVSLARMVVFKGQYGIDQHATPIEPDALYDLDRNVEYYAKGCNVERIEERFLRMSSLKASDLPKDMEGGVKCQLKQFIDSFQQTNKKLYCLDLTGIEQQQLGFKVMRFWSPNTLGLCLPSAPALLHPRFNDYGDTKHEDPHPYP